MDTSQNQNHKRPMPPRTVHDARMQQVKYDQAMKKLADTIQHATERTMRDLGMIERPKTFMRVVAAAVNLALYGHDQARDKAGVPNMALVEPDTGEPVNMFEWRDVRMSQARTEAQIEGTLMRAALLMGDGCYLGYEGDTNGSTRTTNNQGGPNTL